LFFAERVVTVRSSLFPVLCLASVFAAGCGRQPAELTRTQNGLLGTVCTVTLYGGGTEKDLDAAFDVIKRVDALMSAHSPDSEISLVNAAAADRPLVVSPETFRVIREGIEFSRMSEGAFDITVGPLVKLWGIGTDRARVPALSEVKRAVSLIDFRDIVLDSDALTVLLKRKGMAIDLGAIAKGYAADEAAGILESRGVRYALINLGGNVLTLGLKPDGSRWRIGIQDPEKPRGEHLGIVEVSGASVVTSGPYERYFDDGRTRYHHIMDTRTGFPVRNGLLAVTTVSESSMKADAYSTLLFALGLERGRRLLERGSGAVNAVFVTENHELYVSPGIRGSFKVTDPGYRVMPW
jgi:thiamine biosynthesis lipoprotein